MPDRNTSPTPYNNASTSSVRRNLFSAHLSRRPASSQSLPPTQQPSQSQPTDASTQTNNQHSPSYEPPPVGTTQQRLSPQRPPSNPFSPSTTTPTLYPSSSIIALHPVTGRPILPSMPVLPAHLRLSSADSTSDLPDGDDQDTHHDTGPHPSDLPDHQRSASDTYWLSPEESDRADAARIEKSLVEMYYRQRQKQRLLQNHGHSHAQNQSIHSIDHTSTPRDLTHMHAADVEEQDNETNALLSDDGKMETDELMNLIVTSLRKRVVELDEERWMFEGGSHEIGVGTLGVEFEGAKGYN